jgi:hypothetical protein
MVLFLPGIIDIVLVLQVGLENEWDASLPEVVSYYIIIMIT